MKHKYLIITFPNNEVYKVPIEVVAADRAQYFTDDPDSELTYGEEFRFGMENPDELLDWAINNMDWCDLELNATLIFSDPLIYDYNSAYIKSEFEIEDRDE